MSEEDLKSYIKGYYLDRKMTYTKLDKHDRAIGVLLEENKQLKNKINKTKKILLVGFDTQATIFKALEILGAENEFSQSN